MAGEDENGTASTLKSIATEIARRTPELVVLSFLVWQMRVDSHEDDLRVGQMFEVLILNENARREELVSYVLDQLESSREADIEMHQLLGALTETLRRLDSE